MSIKPPHAEKDINVTDRGGYIYTYKHYSRLHEDCVSLSMLVYRLFRDVLLHSSGLVIDDFSTVFYTESGRSVLLKNFW